MIQGYATAIKNHQSNPSGLQFSDEAYIERIKKRHDALIESKEQLRTNNLERKDFKMSADLRGYMMANDLNYTTFDSMVATSYQHCLAQENLNIAESAIDISRRYPNQPVIKEYSNQLCGLAIASQQLNHQSHIEQATAVTDVNDFFISFCRSALGISKTQIKISAGIAKGGYEAVGEWISFGNNLWHEPAKTVGEMANGYAQMGKALIFAAGEICDKVKIVDPMNPHVIGIIATRNLIDQIEHRDNPGRTPEQIKQDHKILNKGLESALQVLDTMAKNSLEDNVAGATKIVVNRTSATNLKDSI